MTSLSRRDLLGSTAALCGAALLPPLLRASSEEGRAPAPTMVVVDDRYEESRLFAEQFAKAACTRSNGNLAATMSRGRDLSQLWSEALEPRLTTGQLLVAGLTLASDLFVLQRLARRSGVVSAYSGSHDWRGGAAPSRHRLHGTVMLDAVADALATGGHSWPERLADALAASIPVASRRAQAVQERHVSAHLAPAPGSPRYFVSWLVLCLRPAAA